MTQAEAVEVLSVYQARPSSRPTSRRQRWYDWVARPVSVSSLALVAAAHLAGMSVDQLLTEAGLPQTSREPADADELKRQMDELRAELARQRELTADVQGRLDDLAARFDVGPKPADATPHLRDLGEALSELARLEREVADLGRAYGRHWETSGEHEEAELPVEGVRRRIGTLEARVGVIASRVSLPYGGYPSAPEQVGSDDVFLSWVREVVDLLRDRISSIQRRVPAELKRARTADG